MVSYIVLSAECPKRAGWRLPRSLSQLREAFLARVTSEPNTGCRLWLGYVNNRGYGSMSVMGRPMYVHRLAWELERGPIPPSLVIDHLCKVPTCTNPNHMRVVTQRVNSTENSDSPSAKQALQTHCIHGHPFDAGNTYVRIDRHGGRVCRQCRKARSRVVWDKYKHIYNAKRRVGAK